MIQFNLLPDVKIKYLKTQRTKRMVIMTSLIVAGVSLAVVTVLFVTVRGVQNNELKKVTESIKKESDKLNGIQDLNKVLTIQNQLSAITKLHQEKPISSRLIGYLGRLMPEETTVNGITSKIAISSLEVNFEEHTMVINGAASDFLTVNKFADTLKFATFKNESTENGKPFTNVVTNLSRENNKNQYAIAASFDPALFANFSKVELVVPEKITNRSVTERPVLFNADTKDSN